MSTRSQANSRAIKRILDGIEATLQAEPDADQCFVMLVFPQDATIPGQIFSNIPPDQAADVMRANLEALDEPFGVQPPGSDSVN